MHAAVPARGRAGDHVLHTRHPSGGHAHDRRGDVRIPPAGDVAARRLDRDELLPRNDARVKLGLELVHARELRFGKGPHLLVRERDVILHALRQGLGCPCDLGGAHHDIARPAVQRLRVVPSAGFAARLDVLQQCMDPFAGIVRARGGGPLGFLEVFHRR